jgi:hypothetical protein
MTTRRKAMSKRAKLAFALAAAAVGAALTMPACESVPLTAAPGTTMTLTANPEFVIANGGVSVVTAILVEPAGTFVPDGTEIFCFTNLGRVDPSGKSVNGVVRVNFVSDARSGTATVTCVSGGPAPAPSASPTASAGGGAGVTAADAHSPVASLDFAATTGENSATVDIKIGNARPAKLVVTANPQVLAKARHSSIVANVFDESGNPVQNVPIIFTLESGGGTGTTPPPLTEVLESGSTPRFTDANGQAFDTLTTRAAWNELATASKTVVVTATPPLGDSGTVDVTVFYTTTTR